MCVCVWGWGGGGGRGVLTWGGGGGAGGLKLALRVPKIGKRKVQGVPQSQTAALPRTQEEEETDKSKQAQIEQTYEKH